ncbi:7306_t:CDS:2, partial [Cetraspora pellucida]
QYILNNLTSWTRSWSSYAHTQYEVEPSSTDENITISLPDSEQCSQRCMSIDYVQKIESTDILHESPVVNSIKEVEPSTISQNDSCQEILYDETESVKNNCPQEILCSSTLPRQCIESQNLDNEIDTCSEFYPAVEQQNGYDGVVSFPAVSPERSCDIKSSENISHDIQKIEETLQTTQSVSNVMPQENDIEKIENQGERCLLDNSLYITVPEDVESPTKKDSNYPILIERPPASLGDMPLDIFIEICYHLSPNSLFALIGVCKQFRNWLRSSSSHITTDIWRTSRTKFITYLPRPPPVGIDEITYIKLAMLERGCQFCGAKTETPKVYWAFRVRCCCSCLRKRITTSPDSLPQWAKSPIDITTVVPYENVPVLNSTTGAKIMAYLNSHLENARREFISTPPKHRANWIQKKKNMVAQILTNVQKRERLDELYLRKKSLEDMRTFKMLIEEFKQTKDEKGLKPYKEKYIVQLPSYIEAKEVYRIPFMTNPWPTFVLRLKDEYTELMKKTVRLEQITNAILSLITSYDTLSCAINTPPGSGYQIYISDPVIDCLHWCPSFCNPPFVNNDPLIPWTDEFLIQTLIPRLRKEARRLVKKSKINRPGPFTTVKGCINLAAKQFDDEDKELFVCKLCWKSSKRLHSYDAICRHLTSGCHSIGRVDNERMIEVDKDVVKKVLPNWFASII